MTVDPCYHTLCTVVEPRLTTQVFVQYELSTPAQHRSHSDVFALLADESSSISKGLVPLTATEEPAPNDDIFRTQPDDELPQLVTTRPSFPRHNESGSNIRRRFYPIGRNICW